jgi:hypothetical protein
MFNVLFNRLSIFVQFEVIICVPKHKLKWDTNTCVRITDHVNRDAVLKALNVIVKVLN